MVLKLATKLFGSSNERVLKQIQKHIEPINALEAHYEAMSDDELKAQTDVFRGRIAAGQTEDDLMHDAFAVVREAAKRVLGMRPYDVQLIGGIVMHQGRISEMKTGEGKTLVATLPTYLNALSGKGVHVVTVNDYLASRDAEWMSEIYSFLGLTCGVITANISEQERRAAYACDITYGTNNEFGFDYLRDNMKFSLDQMVQRDFNFAIVDEVDSILIDEARTPLIISGPSDLDTALYPAVDKIIPLLEDIHYEMDEKHKTIVLNEDGTERVEQLLIEHKLIDDGTSMYDIDNIAIVHHVNQALRAHKLFFPEKDYIVKDGKVILIDEFTGRMMDGRRLSEGLHQAIEAKENVDIQTENQTLASITFQNYFRLYPKLAGMTGTALTEAGEFAEIYNLGVVSIPTHRPVQRIDHQDKIYRSLAEKEDALVALIRDCKERGQPALVGTVSIEKSEELSARLKKEKIEHNVLNARQHEREAFVVAQAGRPGAITIATNMAGRGTDIKLGGNLEMRIEEELSTDLSEAALKTAIAQIETEIAADKEKVKEAGGLYIIGTERHESRRIDNQLRGRSGRQGDAGASMFFLSVEDDLMRIFAGDKLEGLLNNARIGLEAGEALEHPLISKMLERAQGKVEGMHFEVRKNLLKFDNVMNDQRKVIYSQRRELMEADDIGEIIKEMRHGVIEDTVRACIPPGAYAEKWDIEALDTELQRLLAMDLPVEDWAKEEGIADAEMLERILDASDKRMAEKVANCGADLWRRMEKGIALQMLDQSWKEHLLNLDHLRQGINLRAFGQRDPLNEYKAEAFSMFEQMLDQLNDTITMTLSFVEVSIEDDSGRRLFIPGMGGPDEAEEQRLQESREDPALMGTGQADKEAAAARQQTASAKPVQYPSAVAFDANDESTWGKVQRNALCPCGSGKKYKHCHGKIAANG
ncbi:MAG: preprotein translocase subunit SecA [Alphaproteobacteria bacterium]|nr:preprotein translocase subunit SecA [Alphaproteobacteria bacterium]